MSKLCTYAINIPSGSDIAQSIKDFSKAQNLKAAFIVKCDGEIGRASLRMAYSNTESAKFKEISELVKIESLVGTISGGYGHIHTSLLRKDGDMIGGHVYGPLVALGNVQVIIGECCDLLFTREHDKQTGFQELVVQDHGVENLQVESQRLMSQRELVIESANAVICKDRSIIIHVFRLVPKENIWESLKKLVSQNKLKSPFIMTCVGSVTKAVLILDGTEVVVTMEGHYEIVSLSGTPTSLQISLSDKHGHVTTGFVTGDLIVFTTAELVVGDKLLDK